MSEHEHDDDYTGPVKVALDGPLHTRGRQAASVVVEPFTFPAGGTVLRILGRNLQRCRAVIQAGTGTVYVGPTNTVSATTGFAVSTLAEFPLQLTATDELYAFGDNATCVVLTENYDGQ